MRDCEISIWSDDEKARSQHSETRNFAFPHLRNSAFPHFRNSYFFLPTAKTLSAERTYITPFDNAGVAINSSPIVFVAIWENF